MGFRPLYLFSISISVLAAACSPTKHLPEGEKLYTGVKVDFKGNDLTARQRKVFTSDLAGLSAPKPNSRFLGIPFKLNIYNMFRNKKPNSFFGKLRDKYGEPPVLLSSVDLDYTSTAMRGFLENKGFFKAAVTGDTVSKGKKGHSTYTARGGDRYTIRNLTYGTDSSSQLVQEFRQSTAQSLIKPGAPYDLDLIKGERVRIDNWLKERGYFFFSPDFLLAQVDSTVGNNQVDLRLVAKPDISENAFVPYRINDVFIYTNYRINAANPDTTLENAQLYEGYYVVDRRKRFKPKMFRSIMQFDSGDVYNRTDHNQTLSRLINLNEFRYVRNRFEPAPQSDSPRLNAYYYLTPLPKKSLRAEVSATNRSNNMNGTQLTLNWRNRNTFRAGEQLSISAYIGSEIAFGGNFKGYNTYRTGAEANFAIPRFVVPFFNIRTQGGYVPRTNIQLGYDVLNRRKLYTLNSFRGGLGYIWKESLQKQHEFYPININYVQPINVTQEFRDSVKKYPYMERIVDSQFVLGTTYQYTLNQNVSGVVKTNSVFFNGLVDLSGNLAGLIMGTGGQDGKEGRIFNARFDQYIKLEADGRYYRRFGTNNVWANRVVVGYGLPYGNSRQIPYIKQFFAGGNNSIRAFRSRSLLGTYHDTSARTFLPDQTGDMRLELNTEFRPRISGPLYGALFIDAGNVWLKNEDTLRPGARFSKNFLKELALGAGVGIRLDITLFVIRLDVAFPLRKPWESNPWVMEQIRFNKREWRRENVIYNLAIGYPF